jgi:uncharacterized integral membrane protein (TIGR00698 family)
MRRPTDARARWTRPGAEIAQATTTPMTMQARAAFWLRVVGPGLALCVLLGVLAFALERLERRVLGNVVVDALVIALIAGALVRNLRLAPPRVDRGARYASTTVLEVSIVLLGASVVFGEMLGAGAPLLGLIAFSVVGGLVVGWVVGHVVLGLGSKLAVLVGVGGSICGNSAVAATAPAIRASAEDVAAAIGFSALLGIGQILLLPFLVPALGLTHYQYGIVAGISVYAVPQVVAASFAVSTLSGQVATLVKLVRVLFLGPMIVVLRALHGGEPTAASAGPWRRVQRFLPWFIFGFLVLAVLRSVGVVSPDQGATAQQVSKLLFMVAMAGLGLTIDLRAVRAVGPRVLLTALATMSFMLVTGLAGTVLFDLRG